MKAKIKKTTLILALTLVLNTIPAFSTAPRSHVVAARGTIFHPNDGNSGFVVGINYMSAGNNWYDSDRQLNADFERFADDGIKHVSVRVMWSLLEPNYYDDYSHLSQSSLNNVKRVLQAAIDNGIVVNFDFWTQYGYSLGKPSWVGNYWDIGAIASTRNQYVRYMQAVVEALKNYSCIESWTVLNEPYFGTASNGASCGKSQFQTTFPILYNAIKTVDPDRIVTCRFTLSYTPGSNRYDATVYDVFDVFAVTIYLDPSNPSDTRYNSRWSYWDKTQADCKTRNLPLWVIEFGDNNADQEHNRLHYELSLQRFANDNTTRAYAWAWQTRSASSESFNIYDGSEPRPAFYELRDYGS